MSGFEWLFGAGGGATAGGTAAGGGIAAGGGMGAAAIGGSSAVTASEAAAAAAASTYGGMTAGQWAQLGSNVISTAAQAQSAAGSADQSNTLAKAALSQARQEEFVDRRKSASIIAKQKAAGATAGLDISSGTPNELLLDSAYNAELNALNIRKQGRFNSDYYKTQARRAKAQIPGILFGGLLKGYGDYAKMKGP
jgi:hypothetical protein